MTVMPTISISVWVDQSSVSGETDKINYRENSLMNSTKLQINFQPY